MASRRPPKAAKRASSRAIVHHAVAHMSGLPGGYSRFLEELKARIRAAQVSAALAVSRELIGLYWYVGRAIVVKQEAEGWGTKVIDRLADDLQRAFPGMAGFSRTNVYRMRAFFLAYASSVPRPVGQLTPPKPVAGIPWGHNVVLLEKVKDPVQRLWYAQQTIQHGWSRNILVHQIESDLYARQAIARVNRVFGEKPGGLVVDYLGLAHELKEALAEYSERDRGQAGIPIDEAVAVLQE